MTFNDFKFLFFYRTFNIIWRDYKIISLCIKSYRLFLIYHFVFIFRMKNQLREYESQKTYREHIMVTIQRCILKEYTFFLPQFLYWHLICRYLSIDSVTMQTGQPKFKVNWNYLRNCESILIEIVLEIHFDITYSLNSLLE